MRYQLLASAFVMRKVVLGKIRPLEPVLAAKSGLGANYGNQNWSPPRTRIGSQKWSYLAKSGLKGGLVLASKTGPGPGFGSQKWSWEKQLW